MKIKYTTLFASTVLLSLIAGCGGGDEQAAHDHDDTTRQMTDTMTVEGSMTSVTLAQSATLSTVIEHYLGMQAALARDNSGSAGSAGDRLAEALGAIDKSAIAQPKLEEFEGIIEAANEHAEHISRNAGNIDHQREHFGVLSKNIRDLLTISGTDRMLYEIYCPMYNDNAGAAWLSLSEEVKNPYFGAEMPTCGVVQTMISTSME